jgi:drug/metabolite transporter (DMT)-like permease
MLEASASTLGIVCSLGTAVSWASAVILFKVSGEAMPPAGLNCFKNVVALALFVPTLVVLQPETQGLGVRDVLVLLVSGALGIGVADSLFFASLNRLGAGRSAIVDCLYSPFVVAGSMLLLGERLTALQATGGGLIVGAVLATAGGPKIATPRADVVRGVLYGAAAMALMAVSIIIVKHELERLPLVLTTSVRLLGGVIVIALTAVVHSPTRRDVARAFTPQPAWRLGIPASVLGAYVALLLWVGGFKYISASLAAILNQTSALYTVVMAAVFLREPLAPAHLVALVMALSGSVLVLL